MRRMAVSAECCGSQPRARYEESPGLPGLSFIILPRVWFVCPRRGFGIAGGYRGSLTELLGDEIRNHLYKLVYLRACLPSPAVALSLEGL